MPIAPITVLIADDQQLLRSSLTAVINAEPDLTVIAEAASGAEAVRLAEAHHPDIVLMDIRMPALDGIAATRYLTRSTTAGKPKILILTMFELDEYVHGALVAGASGFLLKDTTPRSLLDAIRRTHTGESLFAPAVLKRLIAHYIRTQSRHFTKPDGLTARETEILTMVGCGLSNQEIAETFTISMKTVKTHIGNLLSKLQARDRAQLVIAAYENGLITTHGPTA